MSVDTFLARLTPRAVWRHSPFWIKLLAVVVLVLTMAVVGSLTTKAGSDFPAWLEAVSTAAALGAAMVAARYASNAWNLEIRREEQREKQALRAQAELVATWVNPISCSQHNGRHELGELKVSIRNASDLPVTNASIAYSVRVTRDSGFEVYAAGNESRAVVPPGQVPVVTRVPAAVSAQVQLLLDGGCLPQSIAVLSGIAFTDVGDRHWIREPGRDLVEQPEMLVRARRLSAIR